MIKKKATIGWGALLSIILGLAVIFFVVLGVVGPEFNYAKKKFFNEETGKWIWPWSKSEFKPYTPGEDLTKEEVVVDNSMTALKMAIDSVAKGQSLDIYSDTKIKKEDINFAYYTVSFSGKTEIEENSNDYREWNFVKKFSINQDAKELQAQKEEFVFADYIYGSCPDPSKGKWVDCSTGQIKPDGNCYCNSYDDYSKGDMKDLGIDSNLAKEAKKQGLAPISDIVPIYNIELTTYDKDGNIICKVSTSEGGKKLTDSSSQDLITWGAESVNTCPGNPNFKQGDGCDRDGDGIQGAYGTRLYNKEIDEVLGLTNAGESIEKKKSLISAKDRAKYFPEGVVQANGDNGEGCLDSPTWLECNGIKVYYCGKLGYKSGSGGVENKYYFHMDNEDKKAHSNAGIKLLRELNKNYAEQISSTNKGDNIIIRDKDSNSRGSWLVGAWQYAQSHDLDTLIALGAGGVGGVIGAGISLSMKNLDDPSVYCNGGRKINGGPAVVKCDSRTESCGVCNFELPQDVSKEYDEALAWFAGYGDPKYVVYYEAFPAGEDESWILSPLDISFTLIAATHVGAKLVIPIGSAILQRTAKARALLSRAIYSIPVLGPILKLSIWTAKMPFKATYFVAQRASRLLSSMVHKGTKTISKELYEKMFTKADDVLKGVSDDVLKKFGTNLDEVVKLMDDGAVTAETLISKGVAKDMDELLGLSQQELLSKMTANGFSREASEATENLLTANILLSDPAVVGKAQKAAADLYKKGILPRGATAGSAQFARIGLYTTAAMVLAWEDSINQKFFPLGISNLGMKKPYDVTYEKELDSDADKYIVMLRKDKYQGGKLTNIMMDQVDTRFYLASPCKTNLALVKTNKECWKIGGKTKVTDENGREREVTISEDIPEGDAQKKYGNAAFLSYTVDETYPKTDPRRYENAVKECVDKSAGFSGLWSSVTWDSPKYNTEAIIINPVPLGNTWDNGVNFCYGGSHTLSQIGKIGVMIGSIASGFLTEAVATSLEALAIAACPLTIGSTCLAVPAIEVGQTLVDIGVDVAAMYSMNAITKNSKWPNH